MKHTILIPLVIPSAKVYYKMHRLRLKGDERDPFHGCSVIVGLLKKVRYEENISAPYN